MTLQVGQQVLNEFKRYVLAGENEKAEEKLSVLKEIMLDMDSLPPLSMETATAAEERSFARDVFEHAVILSINVEDKDDFQRYIACLRPFYTTMKCDDAPELTHSIVGLNLLYLLVENRLADFHCELELLSEVEKQHPAVKFCTELDKHLVVGSYDQVMVAAAHPPIQYFTFFLKSLLETVRINIGECVASAYEKISVTAATQILMFNQDVDSLAFVEEFFDEWRVDTETSMIYPTGGATKVPKSEEIPSMRLISQNLSYATELERIV